jgi:ADP-ribose pyrophosphatase YjhB (NUDIX family)
MAEPLPHRIRCSVLVLQGDSLLLTRGKSPETDVEYQPPGGGLEGGRESIYDCARREFREETGADVVIGPIAYIEQFLPGDRNEINFYFLANRVIGDPCIPTRAPTLANEWIAEVRYVRREEMASLPVVPEFLKRRFWDDLGAGFAKVVYVGKTLPET